MSSRIQRLGILHDIRTNNRTFTTASLTKDCKGDKALAQSLQKILVKNGWKTDPKDRGPITFRVHYPPKSGYKSHMKLPDLHCRPEPLEKAIKKMYKKCGCVKGYRWVQ